MKRMSLLLFVCLLAPAPTRGQEKFAASLQFAPADAASYATFLRLGEQWDAISKSKAWQKLIELPLAQDAWKKVNGPDSPLQNKEVQKWLSLAGELVSRECCMIAGESWTDFALILQEVQGTRLGQMFKQLGQLGVANDTAQLKSMLAALNENRDKLKAPDLLLGFRAANAKRAGELHKKIAEGLGDLVEIVGPLKGRLKKQRIGGAEWTVVKLDGTMVPWNEIPWNAIEEQPGEYKALVKRLEALTLTLAIGVHDDFVIVSLGSATDMVDKLGKGKKLSELPEFKVLNDHAERKIDSISYTSKSSNARTQLSKNDIDDMVEGIDTLLENLDLTKEQRQTIKKDLLALAKEWKAGLPEAGATLDFSFATEQGSESYGYDWTVYPGGIQAKPLSLLQHVGGNPILAVVGRSTTLAEDYRWLVKLIKTADKHFENLVLPKLEQEVREPVAKALEVIRPLARELDGINEKMLLPALKDGQIGLVFDAKQTSKQWIKALPETERALPLPELALILGVSDADLLVKALGEYRKIANKAIAKIAELSMGEKFEIPPANQRKTGDGLLLTQNIAAPLQLDPQIVLTAGIGKNVAAFGYTEAFVERLLKPTPLKGHGPLAKADAPLVGAVYFNWEGLIKAATPWVDLVLDNVLADEEKKEAASIRKQVHTMLEIVSVLKTVSSATYVKDKALVTRTETIYRDLAK